MDLESIKRFRAFNRFFTEVIGLLRESYPKAGFTLPEARLLYELASSGHTSSGELARALSADPAYVSRLLQKLVTAGLVAISPGDVDRRRNSLALTREGDAAFIELEAATNDGVAELLEPLDAPQRQELTAHMDAIRKLLGEDVAPSPLILRPHRTGELGWLIHRQGTLYHQEQGWDGQFEALIARIYADFEAVPAAPPKSLWVAELDGRIAGSIFIIPAADEAGVAQLRMLYVEPWARGHGLGRLLVEEAVRFSRASGYRRVMLWTQDCLASARAVYQRAGFVLIREEPHHSFGADLNGQYWALELTAS